MNFGCRLRDFSINLEVYSRLASAISVSAGEVVSILASNECFNADTGMSVADIAFLSTGSTRAVHRSLKLLYEYRVVGFDLRQRTKYWYLLGCMTLEKKVFQLGYEKVQRRK